MPNASLARRLAAILYDSLLILALLFLATLPFVAMRDGEPVDPGYLPHQLVLLGVTWLFLAGFWSSSGRTLGMQAWRLRVEDDNGNAPDLAAATVRFFAAILSWLPLGLGFLWQLWDKDKLTWHDRLSGTRLVYYRKNQSG
jgi:uncharacterized RDD family membrane protein YckC